MTPAGKRDTHPEYRGVHFLVRVHSSWLPARPERFLAEKALYEFTISKFALPNAVATTRGQRVAA
jgi:hypothetical protein